MDPAVVRHAASIVLLACLLVRQVLAGPESLVTGGPDQAIASTALARRVKSASRGVVDELARLIPAGQKTARFVGNARCLECHRDLGEEGRASLFSTYSALTDTLVPRRRGCEGCHGPGSRHASGESAAIIVPRQLTKAQVAMLCTSCHPVRRAIGDPDFHMPGHSSNHVGCLDCHRAHHAVGPKSLRDEPNRLCLSCHPEVKSQLGLRSRHPTRPEATTPLFSDREGKVSCLDCHRPYSRRSDPVGREPATETCQRCHPETKGPFLFEHDGGSDVRQGCLTCHAPHGSPNRHLLKATGRAVCAPCHTDMLVGHKAGPSCTTVGCHLDIHGSNLNQYFVR